MKLSKIIVTLGLLQGYHSIQQAGDAALHTQRVAETLVPGNASNPASLNRDHTAVDVLSDSLPGPARPTDFRPSQTDPHAETIADQSKPHFFPSAISVSLSSTSLPVNCRTSASRPG
ncbi:hypothetical protein PGT21_011128 [Puccinia graminis f. sp. tritici]|uniref:Uncharacterized protein n=1 Tax=Puccinia graminis f. sp. tritici TaxID=56615 RepID=A0A5B0PE02_PUCGR|nr:hypothetical protein PGT21_011128 [Puccinia graminis f. sp. tritici]